MMAFVATVVFMGAAMLSIAAIWSAVAPQWRRIVELATGHAEQPFQPLHTLAQAENRIAVRRWAAASPVPAAVRLMRAA